MEVEDRMMIDEITLTNMLSFRGPTTVELGPLNVLIGANGVGKSNFVNAFGLLHSMPVSVEDAFIRLGGISEVLWGGRDKLKNERAIILEAVLSLASGWELPLRYRFEAIQGVSGLYISNEELEDVSVKPGSKGPAHYFTLETGRGEIRRGFNPYAAAAGAEETEAWIRLGPNEGIAEGNKSLFQQFKGGACNEIREVASRLERIQIHNCQDIGRRGDHRKPQSVDQRGDHLLPDASNLALVFNHLEKQGVTHEIEQWMRRFNPAIKRISTVVEGRSIQVYFHEDHLAEGIPATAASDGTLQFLALRCILLHPTPPPQVCIEEPEIGLHPDAIALLARLLEDASERMQIIISTHSDRLVSCFSHKPECVLVADRNDETGETELERLDGEQLAEWLKEYKLGKLWTKGEIGGVIG